MCEKAYGRASFARVLVEVDATKELADSASFARVLVEVDATKELADSIEVCYSSMGKSMKFFFCSYSVLDFN
ncbi:hypothetical protein Tco_0632185, partial [Tanacetum coccineum]